MSDVDVRTGCLSKDEITKLVNKKRIKLIIGFCMVSIGVVSVFSSLFDSQASLRMLVGYSFAGFGIAYLINQCLLKPVFSDWTHLMACGEITSFDEKAAAFTGQIKKVGRAPTVSEVAALRNYLLELRAKRNAN